MRDMIVYCGLDCENVTFILQQSPQFLKLKYCKMV